MNEPKTYHVDMQPSLESAKSHKVLDVLAPIVQRYNSLRGEDKDTFLKKNYQIPEGEELPIILEARYPILFADTQSPYFFGFSPQDGTFSDPKLNAENLAKCQELSGLSPLEIICHSFQVVMNKYGKLRQELAMLCAEEEDKSNGCPFFITTKGNFSVPLAGGGGDIIAFGQEYLYRIGKSVVTDNLESLERVLVSAESQFFHECLHRLSDEDNLNNKTGEEMTQLGEFLYNPAKNADRNALFTQMSNAALNEAAAKAKDEWFESYDRPWQQVCIIILMYELIQLQILPNVTAETVQQVLANLSGYYASIDDTKRMEILKKYIVMNKSDLYARCHQITQQYFQFLSNK